MCLRTRFVGVGRTDIANVDGQNPVGILIDDRTTNVRVPLTTVSNQDDHGLRDT